MASLKIFGLLAFIGGVFSINTGYLNAQVSIGNGGQSNGLSPAQQILLDMQQTNTSSIGGGSMQLFRFTDKNVAFTPLEGLDRLFNWQPPAAGVTSEQTMGDRVAKFKLDQRRQIGSDSPMLKNINRISK